MYRTDALDLRQRLGLPEHTMVISTVGLLSPSMSFALAAGVPFISTALAGVSVS